MSVKIKDKIGSTLFSVYLDEVLAEYDMNMDNIDEILTMINFDKARLDTLAFDGKFAQFVRHLIKIKMHIDQANAVKLNNKSLN